MTAETLDRLFGFRHALDQPMTRWLTGGILVVLAVSGGLIAVLGRTGRTLPEQHRELADRWKSWCLLIVLLCGPVLLGAAWTVAGVCALGLLCYREFARATGLFRERTVSTCVAAGIVAVALASLDHWPGDRLFFAVGPAFVALISVISIPLDRPQGYIQRTALGVLGFLLFGFSLGYLGNLSNAADIGNGCDYRPIVLLILVAVELNDVFAYCCGKAIGGPKLLVHTSPNKTVSGSVGALLLTTVLVATLGHFLFQGTPMDDPSRLATLGVLIGGLGQLGDLMLSSIKRDIGVKDTGHVLPGHGGLLDRFDSLVLVPPAVYHYLSLYLGPLGAETSTRILTGG